MDELPPGDFQAEWLPRHLRKTVEKGPKMCLEEEKRQEEERRYGEGTRGGRRSKTFRSHAIPETGQVPHGDHADASAPLCPDSPKGRVKQEVIKIESEVEEKKSRSLGKTLAAAAVH